jgi:hypothetical protein
VHTVAGVWDVTATVTNCQTGALIRTVHSLQNFSPDGTFSETANTLLRGSSVGVWSRSQAGPGKYSATYFFFRYLPTGAFASTAQSIDMVTVSEDGTHFSAAAQYRTSMRTMPCSLPAALCTQPCGSLLPGRMSNKGSTMGVPGPQLLGTGEASFAQKSESGQHTPSTLERLVSTPAFSHPA